MPEDIPLAAKELLKALVEIENRAILEARMAGCKCNDLVPELDRTFPYASFNSAECIGKPFDQIPWIMRHQEGCPMDGQEGVG